MPEGSFFISVAVCLIWRFLISSDDAYHRDRVAEFFHQGSDPSFNSHFLTLCPAFTLSCKLFKRLIVSYFTLKVEGLMSTLSDSVFVLLCLTLNISHASCLDFPVCSLSPISKPPLLHLAQLRPFYSSAKAPFCSTLDRGNLTRNLTIKLFRRSSFVHRGHNRSVSSARNLPLG